ncbi:pentapeptide repeat-containing protein [Micromonospora sp. NPDC050200]|uniref:pentapeptide repeat-containing protein n=1 Tax=Micromonospora sp. NPDC050200 TaxID=3155664 RepID=UPI0033E44756
MAGISLLVAGITNWSLTNRQLVSDVVRAALAALPGHSILLAISGLVLITASYLLHLAKRRRSFDPEAPLKVMPWWSVVLASAFVITATWLTINWLLAVAALPANSSPIEQAKLRIDAIKAGLSVGAGTGGAVALALAMRRQWLHERTQAHQERVAVATQHDATERRITESYTKAVDNLGHEKASVRLGALYALERLAQSDEAHRQTIVNVICAYLRMPHALSSREPEQEGESASDAQALKLSAELGERDVRITAQRILSNHLRPSRPDGYWPSIRIDLQHATLVKFDFQGCAVASANFGGAIFIDTARFSGSSFDERCSFRECEFRGYVKFENVQFNADARFERVKFTRGATFIGTRFSGGTKFDSASFGATCYFGDVIFGGACYFSEAEFEGEARFGQAEFHREASFGGCKFHGETRFGSVRFYLASNFSSATFNGDARFGSVRFAGKAKFLDAVFYKDCRFGESIFLDSARFDRATFHQLAAFGGAAFHSTLSIITANFHEEPRFADARVSRKVHGGRLPQGWCISDTEDRHGLRLLVPCQAMDETSQEDDASLDREIAQEVVPPTKDQISRVEHADSVD